MRDGTQCFSSMCISLTACRIGPGAFSSHSGFSTAARLLIVAETRGLSTETQECLKQLYPNLELRNRPLDMSAMAKMAQTTIETLQRWKGEVEHQVTTDENFPWKNLVSTVDRYRSLLPILNEFEDRGFTRMLHSDVDAYFRRGVGSIDEMIAENDACLYFTRKGIWGGLLSLNATEGTKAFLADWRERIDRMPFTEMPRGYGQKSLRETYRAVETRCRWGNLATDPRAFSIAKTNNENPQETKDADLWIGNSNRGRNRKDSSVAFFLKDLERLKREGRSAERAMRSSSSSNSQPRGSIRLKPSSPKTVSSGSLVSRRAAGYEKKQGT